MHSQKGKSQFTTPLRSTQQMATAIRERELPPSPVFFGYDCCTLQTWQETLLIKDLRRATHLTTSTAPARTLGSLPMIETLAAKEPSMLKTTHSMPRGSTVR